jgi:L-ribulose-5-phosphate 3-epimerase
MVQSTALPIGIYEKALPSELSWDERLDLAAQAGYDFVEMSIDESEPRLSRLNWTSEERASLRNAIANSGVRILTMGLSGHRKYPLGSCSEDVRQAGLEILDKSIGLASDLGVRIIQLMGYDVFYEESNDRTRNRFVEGLTNGCEWAGAAGIMLGLENVDLDFINSIEKALHYIREVNSPWLKIFPDMGNLVAAGYEPLSQFRQAKGQIVGLHVKDAVLGQVRGVPFKEGIVPFDKIFQVLSEICFHGPLVVEMWAHLDKRGDPFCSAAAACEFIRHVIDNNFGELAATP